MTVSVETTNPKLKHNTLEFLVNPKASVIVSPVQPLTHSIIWGSILGEDKAEIIKYKGS